MSDQRPQSLVGIEMSLHETGALLVDFRYAANPADHRAGRTHRLRLAMTAKQAREVADDLRAAAAASRQSDQPGHA